jgi:hypothetical protein
MVAGDIDLNKETDMKNQRGEVMVFILISILWGVLVGHSIASGARCTEITTSPFKETNCHMVSAITAGMSP